MDANNPIYVSITLLSILNNSFPVLLAPSLGALIAAATTFLASINVNYDRLTRPNQIPQSLHEVTYDFIIVGGGSAGSVVASRLAENAKFKVLLLEAGGEPNPLNSIPSLASYNVHHKETDWKYMVVPQTNAALASPNNSIPWPRGKSLGGSSVLNLMIYMRGNPNDFDRWSSDTGDPTWEYKNLLEFFKRSEDYHGNFPNPEFHDSQGPLTVSSQKYQPLIQEFMAAAREIELNNSDPNAIQTSTFFPLDATIKNGLRHNTYDAFLRPILGLENLNIVRYAHVTKIHFDSSNRAIGVTYERHGQTLTVFAEKEVILSAGVIGSPHLLMLSGVGPSDHLRSVGIEPRVDLPGVGENLQDHVLTLLGPFLLNDTVSFIIGRNSTQGDLREYLISRTGPFSFNGAAGIGFFSTPANNNPSWPNICLFQSPTGIHESFGKDFETFFGLNPGVLTKYLEGYVGRDANFAFVNLGLPATRGNIKLQSKDPRVHPLIDPKYYSDPRDIKNMVDGLKFIVKFYEETETWKKFNVTFIPKAFPGCEKFALKSDEYFECYARHFTATSWHACGTAKMGKADDEMAVVDSKLRVRKVKDLRVCDSSIFPRVTNGNTHSPSVMVGEKCADLIMKTHRPKYNFRG